MLRFITILFISLHGLVHLLYFGQSGRYFELQPGLVWPDGAWMFSKFLGNETIRILASISLVLAAAGFLAGGLAILVRQTWWRPVVAGAALFSMLIFIVFWNGKLQRLDNQGWIGVLISLAILVAVQVFRWPEFEF